MPFPFFPPPHHGNKDFKTVQQTENTKYCPSLITMCGISFRISHSLSNAKRRYVSQGKLVDSLQWLQTLIGKLQDLQKEGQLKAVHCKKTFLPGQDSFGLFFVVVVCFTVLTDYGTHYFVEKYAEEHIILTPYFAVNRGHWRGNGGVQHLLVLASHSPVK